MENEVKETIEKLTNDTQKLLDKNLIEKLLKDNELEFEFEDKKYRLKKPSYNQKQEAILSRHRKYLELLQDKNNILEADMKKIYASRGIDIDEIDNKLKGLRTQLEDYFNKLGKALKEGQTQEEVDIFKKEIEKIYTDQQALVAEKSIYLESSIEAQINVYYFVYLASLLTEVYLKGKDLGEGNKEPDPGWQRAFSSYQEFTSQNEELVNTAVWYTTFVAKSDI